MERIALMTVETTFWLCSDGQPERCILIVHPDFSVPSNGWKEREEPVTISLPDGTEREATATISMAHYNIRDAEAPLDRRWRLTVFFRGMQRGEIPDGSKILVSKETRDALLPGAVG